ncbi:MAG: transglutaminase domain-containing protein [Acidobacteriota bacterium]
MSMGKTTYKISLVLLITLLLIDGSAWARTAVTANAIVTALVCEDVNKKGQPLQIKKVFNPAEKWINVYIKYKKPYSGYINGTLFLVDKQSQRVLLTFRQHGDPHTDRFVFRIMNKGKFQCGSYVFKAIWSGGTTAINFSISDSGIAASSRLNKPDPLVAALAQQLIIGKESDADKVRAIHDWVANNIEYDIEGARTRKYEDSLAVRVLQRKKGICGGYSNLISAMLDAVGVRNRIVEGWARHSDETWADLLRRSPEADHAWNEVYIGGRWIIIDSTWDAGYTDDSLSVFHKQFSLKYYDPDPACFGLDHSQTKPSITPLDPNDYYFCLKLDEQQKVARRAIEYLRAEDSRYAYNSLWWNSEGISGRKIGDVIEAYVVLSPQEEDLGQECPMVTLHRIGGEWVGIKTEVIPVGQHLFSGGYPLPQ